MRLFFLILILAPWLAAESLSIRDLNEGLADKQVEIRGFLYRTADHQLVLAGEPNLKSCCVGSEKNQAKQLFITNSAIEPETSVSQLSGILRMREGRFILDNAQKIETPAKDYWILYLAGFGLIGGALFFRKLRKENRGNVHR